MSYNQALESLQEIVQLIESDEMDIDQLSTYLKKAQKLIKYCEDRIKDADKEVQKILENEN